MGTFNDYLDDVIREIKEDYSELIDQYPDLFSDEEFLTFVKKEHDNHVSVYAACSCISMMF